MANLKSSELRIVDRVIRDAVKTREALLIEKQRSKMAITDLNQLSSGQKLQPP